MASKGLSEDIPAVLYLVPFLVSAGYGLLLWVRSGVSAILPKTVYLTVTRDPYVFMLGSFAVIIAVIVEVTSAESAAKQTKAKSTGDILQSVAVASIILALLGAWYANGFVDLSGTFTDFILGRYSIIFPAVMVLLSYLVTIQLKLDSLGSPKVLGTIALLLVPAAVYELGKRDTAGGLAIALVLVIVGVGLFLRSGRKPQASAEQ